MTERTFHLHDGRSGAAITVRVVTRAVRNQISEVLADGTVGVRLSTREGPGQADRALIAFLAGVLQVNPDQLEIVAGSGGPDKLVAVTGLGKDAVHQRITAQLAS